MTAGITTSLRRSPGMREGPSADGTPLGGAPSNPGVDPGPTREPTRPAAAIPSVAGMDHFWTAPAPTVTPKSTATRSSVAWPGSAPWPPSRSPCCTHLPGTGPRTGSSDLDVATTRFWAEPAGDFLSPLLTWADPDLVYVTYGKWWLFALGVVAVAGFMVMRVRAPYGVELWGWRITLLGYVLLALGAGAFYWGQWNSYNVLEDIGLWIDVPGALLSLVGSTVLGIALLRRGAKPRLAAVLLLLALPALFGITMVTSLGNADIPAMFAIAMLASAETRKAATERAGLSTYRVPATQ